MSVTGFPAARPEAAKARAMNLGFMRFPKVISWRRIGVSRLFPGRQWRLDGCDLTTESSSHQSSNFRSVKTQALKIYVGASTYNCYGGHKTLSVLGDFLLMGAPNFGEAIHEIEMVLQFAHSGPPGKTLEQLYKDFHVRRATLPLVTFRRAKGRMEIAVASGLIDGRDLQASRTLSLELFKRGFDEVIQAMSLMSKRLKKGDAFDLEAFLAHCEAGRRRIPDSEEDLQQLAAGLEAADQARRDAMTSWEKLAIDWEDFHPKAREILDDPFFWGSCDDFSPNGNDTGADLLEAYRDWLKGHRDAPPMQFLERLAKQWGYEGWQAMDKEVLDESSIGLAFAELKLRGRCDDRVRALAIESIERQRVDAEASVDWPHREERMKTLEMMRQKLLPG
jgi:uncharacterized protein YfeS